jgi:hypothetical protein
VGDKGREVGGCFETLMLGESHSDKITCGCFWLSWCSFTEGCEEEEVFEEQCLVDAQEDL